MIRSRFIVSLTALSLLATFGGTASAQEEQANNYDGGGTGDGTQANPGDFDAQDNWNEGGPVETPWNVDPDSGALDLDEGGVSFDVEQVGTNPYLINVNSGVADLIGYENMFS